MVARFSEKHPDFADVLKAHFDEFEVESSQTDSTKLY
jgi:hypothetical protein